MGGLCGTSSQPICHLTHHKSLLPQLYTQGCLLPNISRLNLNVSVLKMLKHAVTGHHRVTVALLGLMKTTSDAKMGTQRENKLT